MTENKKTGNDLKHWSAPLPGNIVTTGGWGADRSYRANADNPQPTHHGVDLRANEGTPVHAIGDGKVFFVQDSWKPGDGRTGGNAIYIDHAGGIRSEYMHLSKIEVKPGQEVKGGQVIGESGTTGGKRASDSTAEVMSPHLHLQIRVNGELVPPTDFVLQSNSAHDMSEVTSVDAGIYDANPPMGTPTESEPNPPDMGVPTESMSPDMGIPTEPNPPDMSVPTEPNPPDMGAPAESMSPDMGIPTEPMPSDMSIPSDGGQPHDAAPNFSLPDGSQISIPIDRGENVTPADAGQNLTLVDAGQNFTFTDTGQNFTPADANQNFAPADAGQNLTPVDAGGYEASQASDAGEYDSGSSNADGHNSASPDASSYDGGSSDARGYDGGYSDAGSYDAGSSDVGGASDGGAEGASSPGY